MLLIDTCNRLQLKAQEMTLKQLFSGRFGAYALSVGLLIVTTGIGKLITINGLVDSNSMDKLYILSVVISSIFFGFGPALMLSFLSVLVFDFFFIPPFYTFSMASQQDSINFLIFLVVCVVISLLSPQIRS